MKKLIPIFFLLQSCMPYHPASFDEHLKRPATLFYDTHHVTIGAQDIGFAPSKKDIEEQIDLFCEIVGCDISVLEGLIVIFTPDSINHPQFKNKFVEGAQSGAFAFVVYRGPLSDWKRVLRHEMGHFWLQLEVGDGDEFHRTPGFWENLDFGRKRYDFAPGAFPSLDNQGINNLPQMQPPLPGPF